MANKMKKIKKQLKKGNFLEEVADDFTDTIKKVVKKIKK